MMTREQKIKDYFIRESRYIPYRECNENGNIIYVHYYADDYDEKDYFNNHLIYHYDFWVESNVSVMNIITCK